MRRYSLTLLLALAGCASPLGKAAARGDVLSIKQLINAGAELDRRDANSETALMKAAKEGHAEAVRALLEAGADTEIASPAGTALELAALHLKKTAVLALLDGGAHPTAKAFEHARLGGRQDIADLIGARVARNPEFSREQDLRPKDLNRQDVQPGRAFTTGTPDAAELEKMLKR
jgi:ankyrin repeat protein